MFDVFEYYNVPEEEKKYIELKLQEFNNNEKFVETNNFVQHGFFSVYDHSINVARLSLKIANTINFKTINKNKLIRGALLHDYFLYDWHSNNDTKEEKKMKRLHASTHPKRALKNALKDYELSGRERNIIESHMFPINPSIPPKCKEAWIVCFADKVCSLNETYLGFIYKLVGKIPKNN